MEAFLQQETERLKASWMQHDAEMLRDYLVSQVEDPRINLQSILTRHFLLEALFGPRFEHLKAAEIHFAAAMNWLLRFYKKHASREETEAVLHALSRESDNADGIEIPHYVVHLFKVLPADAENLVIPNFIRESLQEACSGDGPARLSEKSKSTFQGLWKKRLARMRPGRISVFEPACGSANDYRFLHAFGLSKWLDYTGMDLCEKNIVNAKNLFANIRFEVGNVMQSNAADKAFEFAFVHDLFEHLSLEAMEVAVTELCRVTKRGLCLHFFNMDEEAEHVVQPVEDYHWNRLSLERMRELLARLGYPNVQAIHIGTFLRHVVPDAETHNENAYTLIAFSMD